MAARLKNDSGEVAVIVSPGYGAGWSTWNADDAERMLFDPTLAQMILDGADGDALIDRAEQLYPDAYVNGIRKARVEWVPVGTRVMVREYDGSESLVTVEDLAFTA